MAHGKKTGGRQAGTPNKATSEARAAIGLLLNGNAQKLNEWLDAVATGVRKVDLKSGRETDEYTVKPNPAKAFDMYQSIMEFYIPKLTRMQVSEITPDIEQQQENAHAFKNLLNAIRQERQISVYGSDACKHNKPII